MASYAIKDDWSRDESMSTEHVTVASATLIDLRDGHEYGDGAYKVIAPGKRTRTFKGETAWMKAQSLARDYHFEIERNR